MREFLKRRAAGYKAYYENMPLRPSSMPQGPDMRLYRRISYGDLA
jgi:alkaline phosphatase D